MLLLLHDLSNVRDCVTVLSTCVRQWSCLQNLVIGTYDDYIPDCDEDDSDDYNEDYPRDICVRQVSSSLQYESQPFE